MQSDPLTTAREQVRQLVNHRTRPLAWLEATFRTVEAMDESTAKETFGALLAHRYLTIYDADMAQMLAQRLGVEVQWSHTQGAGRCGRLAPQNK